jgi:ribosome biogenesis protein BRX1
MSELHFPGNCLKGSRPILSFDSTFDTEPHLLVIKELFTHIFGVPQTSRKLKPFIDHVMGFTVADGKIWVRCFEIKETEVAKGTDDTQTQATTNSEPNDSISIVKSDGKKDTAISLLEIGPRFVLTPIVILESSFGGPVIYENKQFVSPNHIRAELRRARAGRNAKRAENIADRQRKHHDLGLQTGAPRRKREGDELEDRRLFA